jgi:uracil-DNA glycosylase family 4
MQSSSTTLGQERKHPLAECEKCPLRSRPCVPSYGPKDADIIFVGQAPGSVEVKKGRPFIGPSGELLDGVISNASGKPEKAFRTNAVLCYPGKKEDGVGDNEPDPRAVAACRPRLEAEIAEVAATVVVSLGKVPAESLLPLCGQSPNLPISQRRGHWFQLREGAAAGKYLMAAWHPAYVLRNNNAFQDLQSDVTRAFRGRPTHPVRQKPKVRVIRSAQRLHEILSAVPDGTEVAFDIETDSAEFWYDTSHRKADPILMMGLAWRYDEAIIIDDEMLYDVPETRHVLNEFFDRVYTIAHNGKFDTRFLRHHVGVRVKIDFDTILAHYSLNEEKGTHGLKDLTWEFFDLPDYEGEYVSRYLPNKNAGFSNIPFAKLAQYCAWDVTGTLALKRELEKLQQAEETLEWPFRNILMPANDRLTQVEMRGIKVDVPYLQECEKQLTDEMEQLTAEMRDLVTMPKLNPNSWQQIGNALYDVLRLPVPKISFRKERAKKEQAKKKGKPYVPTRPTDNEALETLKGRHPFVDVLKKYRRVAKINSSYIQNMLYYADRQHRVHGDALIFGTETGRLSYKNPALQTIPRAKKDKYGAMIRSAFIAGCPGNRLVVVDVSQAELRVAAALANETFLIEAFRNGRDIHSEVAFAMFGPDYTGEQRVTCKMFVFSYLYGGTEYSFAADQGLPLDVARAFVKRFNEQMPNLAAWKEAQFKQLRKEGVLRTRFGRCRRFPFITEENVQEVRKTSINFPVQSSASDITLLALCELVDEGLPVVLTVHDSILFDVPACDAERIGAHAARTIERIGAQWFPEVPWKCDVEIGERWAKAPTMTA